MTKIVIASPEPWKGSVAIIPDYCSSSFIPFGHKLKILFNTEKKLRRLRGHGSREHS
jgi:hypothetical protein